MQSNSLPAVKEALQRHEIRFVETQVEERGVRVTQVCVYLDFRRAGRNQQGILCTCVCFDVLQWVFQG